jgi:adenosylmethionine-8-amino-7-oxononanoate aminotransferase
MSMPPTSDPAAAAAPPAPDLRREALDHLWIESGYAWEDAIAPDGVVVMERGEGCTLVDADGRRYLDFASGLWLANVGYGRAEIAEAMARQARTLHYTRHPWPTEATVRAAAKLAELAPGDLSHVFFTGGGGEANEAAMKMAVQYHRLGGEPRRVKFIGRDLSYHGASFATMSVGGSKLLDRSVFAPLLLEDATLIPGPGHPDWSGSGAGSLEQAILDAGPDTVAAFIGEPISNSAGVRVPDDDYWPAVRDVCDRYGILLICDEVITGFGRTGKLFAVDHWDVVPDVLTVAKGATSGYVPLGAAIATSEVAERFRPGAAEAFQHVITFGGHAVACAAALANIEIIEREGLVQRSAEMGRYLLAGLERLKDDHPSVGECRGIGLMCALQLAKDRSTLQGFTPKERHELGRMLFPRLLERGVNLLGSADKIAFMPPLVVQAEEIDRALEALDAVLSEIERETSWWR